MHAKFYRSLDKCLQIVQSPGSIYIRGIREKSLFLHGAKAPAGRLPHGESKLQVFDAKYQKREKY